MSDPILTMQMALLGVGWILSLNDWGDAGFRLRSWPAAEFAAFTLALLLGAAAVAYRFYPGN